MSERVAVVGVGSVGVFFAAHFAAAGLEVTACVRRPFDEYIVESDSKPVRHSARCVVDPATIREPFEFVLVGVKAHQTENAARWFEALCTPETTVVVMQNGIEGEPRLAPFVNNAAIVPTVVYCGAELLAPGHTRHVSTGYLLLPDVPGAHRLSRITATSAAKVHIVDDFPSASWEKLAINALLNGAGALTRRPFQTFARADMAVFGRRLLREVHAVAAAEGAVLDPSSIDRLIDHVANAPENGVTSMLQDRVAGRPTEHDAIYGAIIRAAGRHGIDVPIVESVAALVAAGD